MSGAPVDSGPAAPEGGGPPRREVLLVASAPMQVLAAIERLMLSAGLAEAVSYLVDERLPANESAIPSPGWRASLRFAESTARRFTWTVLPLTGERGFRVLKLKALVLGRRRLLIVNENQDYFALALRPLLRHLRWRCRERLSSWRDLAVAAWRIARTQGTGTAVRRVLERLGRRSSMLPIRRLWLRAMIAKRLEMPAWARPPRVSIIVPVHNRYALTWQCLTSIAREEGSTFEVLLVDGGSTDRTRDIERRVSGLRVVRLNDNPGFVAACNVGASVARGEVLVFLNNDVVTSSGWLAALLEVLDSDARCGAVGPKLVFPNGVLQEAGGIVWRDGTCWNYGRLEDPDRSEFNYRREVDYCSGAALMVRTADFRRLGGFDDRYSPGYYEDVDLCFGLRALGRTVWYQPKSVIVHYEGGTSGVDTARGMKAFQALNADKFRDKWALELGAQRAFDRRELFRARDRRGTPVVLVFDHYVPTPDRDAGSAFMYRFLEVLVARGLRVLFWPDNRFRSKPYTDKLENIGVEVLYGSDTCRAWLKAHGDWVDHAIVYRASMAQKYLPELQGLSCTRSYVAVDLEHLREQRRGAHEEVSSAAIETLLRREARLVREVDCVGVHSAIEASILRSQLGAERVVLLPLPVSERRSERASPGFDERRDLVFVGSTHPPNVDALRHFTAAILPRIREALGDVKLWVLGDVADVARDELAGDGIERVGFVPDLADWLNRFRVFVAPLRYGAGLKGKILEAMSHGIPVVTTPVGAEGIGIVDRDTALVAGDPGDFAARTIELYGNQVLWRHLRAGALQLIEKDFSPVKFERAVGAFMDTLEAGRRDRSLQRATERE